MHREKRRALREPRSTEWLEEEDDICSLHKDRERTERKDKAVIRTVEREILKLGRDWERVRECRETASSVAMSSYHKQIWACFSIHLLVNIW